jgi:hypothetical protein
MALEHLDAIWIDCARSLAIGVERGGDAYVHFDGESLFIAASEALDDDDSLAQLVLHELCHLAVQGPTQRYVPDWGLDNTTNRDDTRERAAVRLQAHLAGGYGLRDALFPTTVVRPFYESLPHAALGDPRAHTDDSSIQLAHQAATRMGRAPLGDAIATALDASARALARVRHPSGFVTAGDARTCGSCAWRTTDDRCLHAP